ncbi:MAG: hypothetical protein ACLURV_06905 [Gallintestinimicrobium sp.]
MLRSEHGAGIKELIAYGKEKNILVTLEDFDGPVQPFARMYQLLWFMERMFRV